MRFEEAKKELKKLANGKYHSLKYSLTEFSKGTIEATCDLYIDPGILVSAPTWAEALKLINRKLGEPGVVDLSEMPGEEERTE